MKKEYISPEVEIESFEINEGIATGMVNEGDGGDVSSYTGETTMFELP